MATWLRCHRRPFEWFGAVPERVIIDNPKCAITRACNTDPLVQRAYGECAKGYRFKIDPCPPRDPQKKGIVEAGVKYVKGNFLPLRSFRNMADLSAPARSWVLQEAGMRIHGTTRKAPLTLFALEKPLMRTLPAIAPDLGSWDRVSVAALDPTERLRIRQERAAPAAETLRRWLILHRQKVPDGSGTAKAIDYSLNRWAALIRYLKDGNLPIDINWVDNRIRPVALGRSNGLFAGSLRAGQRAAAVMSLIQSAKLNGHDPYRYRKDVPQRLPTQRASQIEELLPHRWVPAEIS